jgi:hypothetical protein
VLARDQPVLERGAAKAHRRLHLGGELHDAERGRRRTIIEPAAGSPREEGADDANDAQRDHRRGASTAQSVALELTTFRRHGRGVASRSCDPPVRRRTRPAAVPSRVAVSSSRTWLRSGPGD